LHYYFTHYFSLKKSDSPDASSPVEGYLSSFINMNFGIPQLQQDSKFSWHQEQKFLLF